MKPCQAFVERVLTEESHVTFEFGIYQLKVGETPLTATPVDVLQEHVASPPLGLTGATLHSLCHSAFSRLQQRLRKEGWSVQPWDDHQKS